MDKKESFKSEVYKKMFEACHRMYDLDMYLCEFLSEETRKRAEDERREAYNEIIYRIQDYEDYLCDEEPSELNFNDYESLS